ncbi:EAL domain-containing protein [Vogesella sp. LIG4]|uniref:EAL domain-containing response regulator n=1 Tax=Vogesella sp. LIG4 TaxID=1192162 RepID=UPI00081F9BBE|nr:EAL domain-containing response regulator [Vogesella sp. LIG4]SCK25250.1 EAL domain, c-di-GMP-specific phosphodiesterase class I (or its enzymatically inactive variant) [Vogesella sp. LIG4]
MPSHILIAEDSSSQRSMLAALCQLLPDVEVHQASDGRWALQTARQLEQLDLVITDLNMPGMDGIELIEQLSRLVQMPTLLLLSGHVPELLAGCMRAAEELGFPAIAYLAKPIDVDVFQAEVQRLLLAAKRPTSAERAIPLAEIFSGLAQNQFCAFFQPIYSQTEHRAVQVEALARWQHPAYGVIGPASFINRLEHEGFIVLLTRRIVQTSLDLLARDPCAHDLRLSINLSRSLLEDAEFFDWLVQEVESRGLQPQRIVLEITETMAFSDLGHTLVTLLRLRMRGFELSLDDFGTGHTNLEQLKELPLTELKLDRSLIRGIHQAPRSQSILDGIIRIGRELKLRMVAEGLDNRHDLAYLQGRYPDLELQGFLLSVPVSADELARHLGMDQPDSAQA